MKSIRKVAPVRERGLKSYRTDGVQPVYGRSREGAWIEMICTGLHLRF